MLNDATRPCQLNIITNLIPNNGDKAKNIRSNL